MQGYFDENNLHYTEIIVNELKNMGWKQNQFGTLYKRFQNAAPAGTVSDGGRKVTARFCKRGRYLCGEFGWDTNFDIDGRIYCEKDMLQQAAVDFDAMAFNALKGEILTA